jgi:hypothetical protein
VLLRRDVARACSWLAVMLAIASVIQPARAKGDVASARSSSTQPALQQVPAKTLLDWRVLGIGSVEAGPEPDTIRMSEGANSKGVVLLSPEPLPRDFILRLDVKPLQAEGIPVVLLSAAPIDGSGMIDPGPDYDGAVDYWTGEQAPVQSYAIGFHTSYHQPYAFIRKNPGYLKAQCRQNLEIMGGDRAVSQSLPKGGITSRNAHVACSPRCACRCDLCRRSTRLGGAA